MAVSEPDLQRVMEHARTLLPPQWPQWPGGYPQAIELALLDAVFSIRARYGHVRDRAKGRQPTGVPAVVEQWSGWPRRGDLDDLAHISTLAPDAFVARISNRAQASGRLKSEVVHDAATRLVEAGICTSDDLRADVPLAKSAYIAVPGLGCVTFTYLCMLSQVPGVKADTWVRRFVQGALGRSSGAEEAAALVHAAADRFATTGDATMPHDASTLDHALWSAMRSAYLAN